MKITILPADRAVYKDEVNVLGIDLSGCGIPEDIHALQWDGTQGWIEYKDQRDNLTITELPAWVEPSLVAYEVTLQAINNPVLSDEEKLIAIERRAKAMLFNTDWTQMPDINLANLDEWNAFRQAVRVIATNPTLDAVFPTKPQAIWGL